MIDDNNKWVIRPLVFAALFGIRYLINRSEPKTDNTSSLKSGVNYRNSDQASERAVLPSLPTSILLGYVFSALGIFVLGVPLGVAGLICGVLNLNGKMKNHGVALTVFGGLVFLLSFLGIAAEYE